MTMNPKRLFAALALVVGVSMSLAASFLTATVARAADDREAGAIIDRAIKAHGGAENLSQFKAVSAKWAGKRKVENMFYWDAVHVVSYQMPDRIRFDIEVTNPNGNTFSFSRVVSGKKGWQGSARGTRDLKEAEVAQMVDEVYAHWLASTVPLVGKGFEFSLLGNLTVDEKEAVGVRVSARERPDVNLYFDKKTGLALKSDRRARDPLTNQEFTAESIYRDHKPFHGVMWPTSRLDRRDGMDLEENSGRFELSEYQAHEKVDEASLARP